MVVLLLHTHMYSSTVYSLHALVCLCLSPLSNKPLLLSHKTTLQKMNKQV